MNKSRDYLTEKEKHDILDLFFRTELRVGEKIIDNSDKTISNELNIKISTVSWFISKFLNIKERNLNKRLRDEEDC